ncbi:MAG TPA: hypothetical protein DEP61_00465 [Lachnospiraceae bacterium]|nr:hypothetical protein [Lachnospiraceae bacterium]
MKISSSFEINRLTVTFSVPYGFLDYLISSPMPRECPVGTIFAAPAAPKIVRRLPPSIRPAAVNRTALRPTDICHMFFQSAFM